MLLDKNIAYPQLNMMKLYWKISAGQLLQIAIAISLMLSFNVVSHASMAHSDASVAHEINHTKHVEGHVHIAKSIIDHSDMRMSAIHAGDSKHLNMQGDDAGSCCAANCAAINFEEFTELVDFSIRDTHLLNIERTILSNRLDAPHRPPNA